MSRQEFINFFTVKLTAVLQKGRMFFFSLSARVGIFDLARKKPIGPWLVVLALIGLSVIPLIDLLQPGLPVTHDGQDHVARIANFYQSLSEGNLVPRWAGNLNWGFGHPILMFLYPLPSYIASFFHVLDFSFVDSVKLVFGVSFIASGVTMFLWTKQFLPLSAAFFASILYMFAPYRFVDLYVRGAIGEHVAFVFPPLVFYFLLKLTKSYQYRYLIGTALSVAFLILSHNAISLMFLPLLGFYAVYVCWQKRSYRVLLSMVVACVLGFSLASFFWVPAFFEGKYTLRDVVTGKGEYAARFVNPPSFLFGAWDYGGHGKFTVGVGVVQWTIVLISLVLFARGTFRKEQKVVVGSLLLIFFMTLFLMTAYSEFLWGIVTLMQKFQFPWRLLSITVFVTAVLGGYSIAKVPKQVVLIASSIGCITILLVSIEYFHAQAYSQKPEQFYTGVYDSTTDTGESSPIWSVRFMEQKPHSGIEVIEGLSRITPVVRTSTVHTYTIESQTKTRIKENTLYFPGWRVFVDGKETKVEFQDPRHRGLMTFFVPEGEHTITVRFGYTRLRFAAEVISLVSVLFVVGYPLFTMMRQGGRNGRISTI